MPDPYITKPKVYVVGRQTVVPEEVARFLQDEGLAFTTDAPAPAEMLAEIAGRTCYMSFGKGRKSNQDYVENILSFETRQRPRARRVVPADYRRKPRSHP